MSETNIMNGWSAELREKTRAAICEYDFIPFNEGVHFKKLDSKYGFIRDSDIISDRLLMVNKRTKQETLYSDADQCH